MQLGDFVAFFLSIIALFAQHFILLCYCGWKKTVESVSYEKLLSLWVRFYWKSCGCAVLIRLHGTLTLVALDDGEETFLESSFNATAGEIALLSVGVCCVELHFPRSHSIVVSLNQFPEHFPTNYGTLDELITVLNTLEGLSYVVTSFVWWNWKHNGKPTLRTEFYHLM